jgi:hypothetical protein
MQALAQVQRLKFFVRKNGLKTIIQLAILLTLFTIYHAIKVLGWK